MINYSIIIPHKDIPDLLQRCLDSIPVRDDVQVIVVDDNSDVAKVDFDHFPQWKGKHYETYFTKEGRGAGYARNVGLEHAIGKWLLFADADDFLSEDANRIFDENVDSDADIVFFRPQSIYIENTELHTYRADLSNCMIDGYWATGVDAELRTRFFVPWSKFVKRKLIEDNHIQFEEIRYSNDVIFSVTAGVTAKTVEVSNSTFYIVTQRDNSLASNFLRKEGELDCRSDAFFRAQQIVREHGYPLDISGGIMYLSNLLVENQIKFIYYSRLWIQWRTISKLKLVKELTSGNSFRSRMKRFPYALYLLYFRYRERI